MSSNINIKIEKSSLSKLSNVDFENLTFGQVSTDHMFECDFKNGKWLNPLIKPFQPITLEPTAKVFHYGQAIFEGMKAYRDDYDNILLFRPIDNIKRLNISAKRLEMPPFPEKWFIESLESLLRLDKDWIKKGNENSLYIRPFIIATETAIAASPSSSYKFVIICSPVKSYYKGQVKLLVAQKFSRSAKGGTGFTKAAGNYAGQFYPTKLANNQGYQQIIWTDACSNENIEESGTMNIFFRINNVLITPPTSDRILDGITRKSLIELAKSEGIEVEVRQIKVDEIIKAHKDGILKEIFGTGTAVVVTKITGFGYKEKNYNIQEIENSYGESLKTKLIDIQTNRVEDTFGWRHVVE